MGEGSPTIVLNAGLGMRSVNPAFLTDPMPFWAVPVEGFRAPVKFTVQEPAVEVVTTLPTVSVFVIGA